MLAGPDLLVILGIALIVFGPNKLPELAKTIGKAMEEFKKTAEGIKESVGIKDFEQMKSNSIGMDLFTHLAEKVSASTANEEGTGDTLLSAKDPTETMTSSPVETAASGGTEEDQKKTRSQNRKCDMAKGVRP